MGMTAADDPTMALIRQLDDPTKWSVKRRVSVFKPHTRNFPAQPLGDGRTVPARRVVVTDADLTEIAANVNRAYQRDGTLVKLNVGHRQFDPRFPEPYQPPLVGYARNYRAELVDRPGGRVLRLTHDEYVPVGKTDVWDQYPERSPDYDPAAKTITGVALLVRDPALDLGTVGYHAGTVTYAMGPVETRMPLEEGRLKHYARMCRKYSRCAQYMDEKDDGDMSPDEKAEDGEVEQYMRKRFPKAYEGAMGPTNGALPAVPPAPPEPTGQMPYQKVVLDRIATLERDRDEARQQAATERTERAKVECARMLDGVTPYVRCSYQKELTTLAALPTAEARNEHIAYMLDNYEKLPTAPRTILPTVVPAPADDARNPMSAPANHEKVMAYMRAHPGTQYMDAALKVQG